jgi:hypothetical protein
MRMYRDGKVLKWFYAPDEGRLYFHSYEDNHRMGWQEQDVAERVSKHVPDEFWEWLPER